MGEKSAERDDENASVIHTPPEVSRSTFLQNVPSQPALVTHPLSAVNWSRKKKLCAVGLGLLLLLNATLASSLPSNATSYILTEFHITTNHSLQNVLPISVSLIGYIIFPCLLSPLSETYGRRPILLLSFFLYIAAAIASAVAPNWTSFLIFRFLVGGSTAAPYPVVGAIFADLYDDPTVKGRGNCVFMTTTTFGLAMGSVTSGFVAPYGWRWCFWIAVIVSGIIMVPLLFLPETYLPIIVARSKAAEGTPVIHKKPNWGIILTRPLRMFSEPIVLFTSIYLAVIYAMFYLFFESLTIIYKTQYGMSPGIAALAFVPICIGASFNLLVVVNWDRYLSRAKVLNNSWTKVEEYRRLPVACCAGPVYAASLFLLAFTARPSIHWIVPMLSGLPYGLANALLWFSLLNYLTDAYGTAAASALAASQISRSATAVVLPLAVERMYAVLGVDGATSLLGGISAILSIIPFAFIKYGGVMRANSRWTTVGMKSAGEKGGIGLK